MNLSEIIKVIVPKPNSEVPEHLIKNLIKNLKRIVLKARKGENQEESE